MKSLIVTKIFPKSKFEGNWGELEAKNCFQRQSWKKYVRQTLNSAIRENFDSYFSAFLYWYQKKLSLEGRLASRL